ncbi:M16 family metallopeptidase [Flavobacterium gawalongense]|uniref:Insulinase family protein n=1 Tax=Flavobacterium gawalongense TaxID=2594432 RepID=A0A553BG88_9FLAO|nr:pitrilysin family protein [Flavobacterium gawalongense]TRW99895.1 insulinase family protein [Flavobacterium gawalongense]TRX04359.1 insulinase family protein [Flavobacterium gawalongense]TRX07252.1 insulinase family protein [Flavobacterium gawalongense]TRX08003.1 insulinase family protein [Flavobacterium gawalongense]TRX24255.1 insulinase family protein [Flavobacterium gawalongense]
MKKIMLHLIFLGSFYGHAQMKADDVKTFTLTNGMKFLVVEDFSIPNANMYLFYKVGSRNEYQGITGLSHFFEHMMFNGAKKYGPKLFDQTMEFNGGANNAYTTENVTVYSNWFPASASEVIFDLEGDRISSLSIDPTMVESERGVVLSERRTGLENSPWRLLSQSVQATAFQEHPYHWPVIGYEDDMKNWTQQDLERYFKTYYAPNNCVVVVSGAIKMKQVKEFAKKYLEIIPAQAAPPKVHIIEPAQTGERRIIVKKEVATPYLMIGYHTPESKNEDYYALNILSSVLSSGNSSRLYASLIDQKQLATQVFTDFRDSFDPKLFNVYAVANKDVKEADLEQAIYVEIEKIKKEGISETELQKIKNQKLMEFYSQVETIDGKSNNIGTYEVFFGDYRKMFNAPANYNKITVADVQNVAKKYFTKSNRTVGVLKTNVED